MKITAVETTSKMDKLECLLIAIDSEKKIIKGNAPLSSQHQTLIKKIATAQDLGKSFGSITTLFCDSQPNAIILIECGNVKQLTAVKMQTLLANAFKAVVSAKVKSVLSYLHHIAAPELNSNWIIQQSIIACHHANYQFSLKSEKPKPHALKHLSLALKTHDAASKKAIKQGDAIGQGVRLTRDLGNEAPNTCTPTYLAQQAKKLASAYERLSVSILTEAQMEKLGMGALLGVSQGSVQPAKMIVMQYQGAAKSVKPIVFVGKGVTFDSGGNSLKSPMAMIDMKYDMCGGGTVFGCMKAVCEMKLPINFVGIIPASENMPGGNALKPSDVVTSMAGLTIEVRNTDAEGRLLLCDALAYAKKFKPAVVVDMATLTGAAVAAFGHVTNVLLGNNQDLVDTLLDTCDGVGERAWQLPLFDEYQKLLDSKVADVANISPTSHGLAGTITSACFLARFTKDYDWAHIDIAGTSFNAKDLATGRPVAALTQYLIDYRK